MSSPADSLTGTTAVGATMDPLSPPPPPPTDSPPNTPTSVPPVATTSLPPDSVVSPAPPPSSSSDNGLNGPILVPTDGNSAIYTTTVYSTRTPSPTFLPIPNQNSTTNKNLGAIIAGIAGGVGLLFLLVGVTWFIWIRRAKRRAGMSLINDRKFYPDRYNQTMTSNRHSRLDEIEPGPVVVQPLPPDSHQTSCPPPGPLSRQTSLYHDNITPSRPTRGNWVAAPMDEVLGSDVPPLTRHRFPYPSTPQSSVDPYTALPEFRSTCTVSVPTAPLRFAPDPPPPPPRPQHFRSSSSTHHSHHSHHSHRTRRSHHSHSHHQRNHAERESYFPPIPVPNPVPVPVRISRRNTVFVSPTMSPSSFSVLSNPPPDLPTTRAEPITVTLTTRPSAIRSKFSSIDSLAVINETKRMTVTNPDLDVDLETDTEHDGSSKSGGSPSATDIIRLYDRDQDQDTSPASSMLREKDGRHDPDPSTMSTIAI